MLPTLKSPDSSKNRFIACLCSLILIPARKVKTLPSPAGYLDGADIDSAVHIIRAHPGHPAPAPHGRAAPKDGLRAILQIPTHRAALAGRQTRWSPASARPAR